MLPVSLGCRLAGRRLGRLGLGTGGEALGEVGGGEYVWEVVPGEGGVGGGHGLETGGEALGEVGGGEDLWEVRTLLVVGP